MSAINFPNNPSINDEFTQGEKVWRWNGFRWRAIPLSLINVRQQIAQANAAIESITIDNIADIADVTITSVADGDVLIYDVVSGDWINAQVSGVQNIDAGLATTVFSVADININGGNS